MGLFFYNKIGSIISIVDLPTTNIIESKNLEGATLQGFILLENLFKPRQLYLQPQNSVLSSLRLAS
ncbi:hypothetical protein RLB90_10590, partial [Streptococcus pneumoniae]|nr:hypothetical protein [Streptococcus pneumoniae]MDS2540864.1 hypothetical protein [Streptococcus pneumoniae]MDS3790302.1 hypothetical protein [Streptococcus pneumoniae]MDS5295381.1 hypothetical protein [Streptococcus pneumoniae]MDS5324028.1 hypothetical protein [Streptococcus pneumoniae]